MTETERLYKRLIDREKVSEPNPLPSWWAEYKEMYWKYLYSPVSTEYHRRKEAVDQSGERR